MRREEPTNEDDSLDQLVDDVLMYILKFVDLKDLLSISQTCKRFCALSEDDSLWKDLYRRDFYLSHQSFRMRKKSRGGSPFSQIYLMNRKLLLRHGFWEVSRSFAAVINSMDPELMLEDVDGVQPIGREGWYSSWKEIYKDAFTDGFMLKKPTGRSGDFQKFYSPARRRKLHSVLRQLYSPRIQYYKYDDNLHLNPSGTTFMRSPRLPSASGSTADGTDSFEIFVIIAEREYNLSEKVQGKWNRWIGIYEESDDVIQPSSLMWIICKDMPFSAFRSKFRIRSSGEKSRINFFVYSNTKKKVSLSRGDTISKIYQQYRNNEDGMLYVIYSTQSSISMNEILLWILLGIICCGWFYCLHYYLLLTTNTN